MLGLRSGGSKQTDTRGVGSTGAEAQCVKREFCFCFGARKNSCGEQRNQKASFCKGGSRFVTGLQQTSWFEAAEVPPYSFLLPIPKGCPVSVLPFREETESEQSRAFHMEFGISSP